MKEKLNKKEQHKLYALFTIYRSNIVGKTNQFKHNSLFINLFCLSVNYYIDKFAPPTVTSDIITASLEYIREKQKKRSVYNTKVSCSAVV